MDPIDQKLVRQSPPWLIDTEIILVRSATPYIIQRRPTDPNGRFSVRLAQRQYMTVNTVTARIRVIPRLTDFDRIRRQLMHDSRLTLIPA